jgi:hypothetical protein
MNKIPLWRGDHVSIKQLAEDFARYPYLPRWRDTDVLMGAVRDGLGLLLWHHESFAYADSFDEASGRYRGLRCGPQAQAITPSMDGLLVQPEVALKQQSLDTAATPPKANGASLSFIPSQPSGSTESDPLPQGGTTTIPAPPRTPKRFHGTVALDPKRVGRDASRIADEVIAHLESLVGSNVKVTLEIEASIPSGAPDNVVRIITENSRTLKFVNHGFEEE